MNNRDFTTAPVAVRHARLIGILQELETQLHFGGFEQREPEAFGDILLLLNEGEKIIRSLQKNVPAANDFTMTPE